ncbi:YrhB domain-containing protein [Kitasatospora sp. NPDC004615]|uniref:YrhB domain-containing protein n=1 Tax=Kitasatospora sp. NPDC004615 TaxID=3364017 RepID=UPI003691797D
MIERETAIRVVEEQLESEYRRQPVAGRQRMVVTGAAEHELVWIVGYTSEEFARTGDPAHMPGGCGLYLVDRLDGGLHSVGTVSAVTGDWEADYRARIRGLPVRTAVDDLHDEIRELDTGQGNLHAVRALRRRLPVLTPTEALQYVRALRDGGVPAHLAAVPTAELVEPLNPVLAVHTVRAGGGNPMV